jgi:hypothetical protein
MLGMDATIDSAAARVGRSMLIRRWGAVSQKAHEPRWFEYLATIIVVEARHMRVSLSTMRNTTDRTERRGIAQMKRLGWYRAVHVKTIDMQKMRTLLANRKLLKRKLIDIENHIRGALRAYGLLVGAIARGAYEARIRELTSAQQMQSGIHPRSNGFSYLTGTSSTVHFRSTSSKLICCRYHDPRHAANVTQKRVGISPASYNAGLTNSRLVRMLFGAK